MTFSYCKYCSDRVACLTTYRKCT